MAPPPSASLPLTQRLLQLAQTLQFAWFLGHLTLLFCITRYALSYVTFNFYSTWAVISYRTAFVSAAVTYGIVVYKAFRAKSRTGGKASPGYLALLADENVQYLVMAFVWLIHPQYPIAMTPFGVYSIFHVLTYTRTNLIPTLSPSPSAAPTSPSGGAKPAAKSSPTAESIGKFVKEYYDLSMALVASLEVATWIRLFLSAIVFTKGSWLLLVVYTIFLRARFAQSSFVQGSFRQLTAKVDAIVGGQAIPEVVRSSWENIKHLARQFHDATEVGRYFKAPAQQKKTT